MLKLIFDTADQNLSGHLELEEFTILHENSTNPEVKNLMKKVFELADKAGWITPKDGKLDLDEFTNLHKLALSREDPSPDAAVVRHRCINQYYLAKDAAS